MSQEIPSVRRLLAARSYISSSWNNLTRSPRDLHGFAIDPKMPKPSGQKWKVYIAATDTLSVSRALIETSLSKKMLEDIDLIPLPDSWGDIKEHGVMMSLEPSGAQWDAPFGWGPLHHAVVFGLLRYGHSADALRIATKFLSICLKEFEKHTTFFEKYDMVEGTSETEGSMKFGYDDNVKDFGMTMGVFSDFERLLLQSWS